MQDWLWCKLTCQRTTNVCWLLPTHLLLSSSSTLSVGVTVLRIPWFGISLTANLLRRLSNTGMMFLSLSLSLVPEHSTHDKYIRFGIKERDVMLTLLFLTGGVGENLCRQHTNNLYLRVYDRWMLAMTVFMQGDYMSKYSLIQWLAKQIPCC